MSIKTPISERIRQVFDNKRISFKEFCDISDVKYRTLQNYADGRSPSAEFLIEFNRVWGVSSDWILTGQGSMYLDQRTVPFSGVRESAPDFSSSSTLAGDPSFYGIKLYKNPVSAGYGSNGHTDEFTLLYFPNTWFDSRNLIASNLVAVNVPGDSQEPVIPAGSVVLVDVTDTEVKNEQFYVFNVDDDVLIKEMHLTFDGYIAKSKNKIAGYDDIILTKEKISTLNIIGRAVRALPDIAL